MKTQAPEIYEGIYFARGAYERIEVIRPLFWFVKRYEPWKPVFPEWFAVPANEAPGDHEDGVPYKIRFSGSIGEAGSFGYLGRCRRVVQITAIHHISEV